jgi:cysteinyl-tRNA synthetase
VYFSIGKYRAGGRTYGQLVKLNFDEMRAGARVKSDDYAKEAVADFALWKARVPEDGGVFWTSRWGEGRPGWHIECSAMSMKILGPSFDLHLGGEDLMFPHHEDEIAQSEGATGQPFVKYWLHGAHLLVEGRKMAKSLGNFFALRDLLAKGFTGREIRYLLMTAHYRETFNFTLDGLQGARTALARIDECVGKLQEVTGNTISLRDENVISEFEAALDDDLNVSSAWRVVFDWVKATNKALAADNLSLGEAKTALATWHAIRDVFGLEVGRRYPVVWSEGVPTIPGNPPIPIQNASNENLMPEIVHLVIERHKAKTDKNFKQADAIRDELKAKGWLIEDTPKGPKLKKN